jgi:hypothetical protein
MWKIIAVTKKQRNRRNVYDL